MNKFKFTVVMCVWQKDSPLFFKEALESLFKQTCMPDEVLVICNGPITDELEGVLNIFVNRYRSILKVIRIEKNIGLGPALNEGLTKSSYDLIARMDSDDISKMSRFEKELDVFQKNKNVSVVGSWCDEFEDNIASIITVRKVPENNEEIIQYSKTRNPINHPTVMFKKSAITAVGGYELLGLLDDYLLWMKLIKAGYEFYNIQESLLFYRAQGMYKRRGGIKYAIAEFKFQRKLSELGLISKSRTAINILIRCSFELIPPSLRQFFYKHFLR